MATSKVYVLTETAVVWTDTAGDEDLDLGALAADAGRVGSALDRGASAHSGSYLWELKIDGFDTAPVVGETIDLYFALTNSTTDIPGPVGYSDTADSALGSTDQLPNLLFAGSAIVRSVTAADDVIISGELHTGFRYIIPVIHNNTADALLGTSDAHTLTLTPYAHQGQAT